MAEKKYTKEHEWVEVDGDTATVGITNHAQESLGDIVFIDLPTVGKEVKSNEELCVIESVKAASDIYAPIDGEVIEINNNLNDDASIVNQDPEKDGWIFKMKIADPSQYNNLMTLDEYLASLEN
ncbi:MAG: glycine cleavage system protein GcvH [Alphaproteobacteria bacterium]|jgi:glycine cleavage system H protein|nr:glycine cleavage system protein GcvH [Alphaproteobacteria bacterium]MDB0003292.1 glycine cleavage system protein GcvH [Alphaproteobacteria bacterium]MDC0342771.1 glycine cleavage system protein GcvH [Alphaproteobacteria bacterium]|tara:strand:+ start:49 stop:420 length:372 start_codon:yes stop_codon:yes gene_type:complete